MKVYTGTGDKGKTSLFSGERIAKNDARIEAYGAIDELNAIVGAVVAALPRSRGAETLKGQLTRIQSDLFHVGAWLATTRGSPSAAHLKLLDAEDCRRLEDQINAMQAELDELRAFILPGGHKSAVWAHLARTVCRRAERRTVALAETQTLKTDGADAMLIYINRLSDYFFVLARYCNRLAGLADEIWQG